ncbi:MAG: hypothetical protein GY867_12790 [bacterium]|nr:hypothetical protein [bacterium]
MDKRIDNQNGNALLITISLILMLTLAGIMAVNTSVTDIDLSFHKIHSEKAFYIAEAGAKRALAELKNDQTWNSGFYRVVLNGGAYSVQLEDSSSNSLLGDTIVISSTAFEREGKATVELMVIPEKARPFRHAMFGDDLVDIRNSMNTDSYNSDSGTYAGTKDTLGGDVGSNGNIIVKNGASVGGDVGTSTTGGASVNGGATVYGDIYDDGEVQELPEIPQSEYDWAEANNDALTNISGSYSYNSSTNAFTSSGTVTLTEGTYFFSSITLKNSADLLIPAGDQVTIYITGDIELKHASEVNAGGDPAGLVIFSQGDFVLKNSGEISAAFYSPEGSADLRNSGEYFGSITAKDIVAHNSAKFHYDRSLGEYSAGETGDMEIVAWKEL